MTIPKNTHEHAASVSRQSFNHLPRHIAMIMDGNGRWAQMRGLPRIEGHRHGADTVRTITRECNRLGIEQLTLFCLSSENWKRPQLELDFLMALLNDYLDREQSELIKNSLGFSVIGERERLPIEIQRQIQLNETVCRNHTGLHLCLAINYGSRTEIVSAAKKMAQDVTSGDLLLDDIDERLFEKYLYTAGMPDPDLLIRTSGEMRISNFLLWQISYSEIVLTKKYWPDFTVEDLHQALREFSSRERRFGGLSDTKESPC